MADELIEDLLDGWAKVILDLIECRRPAYGHPAHPHCAACCYGTGLVITCDEDQALADALTAIDNAARLIRAGRTPAPVALEGDTTPPPSPAEAKVVDLMAALEESVTAAKAARRAHLEETGA